MSLNPLSTVYSYFLPQPAVEEEKLGCRETALKVHKNQLSGNVPGFLSIFYLPFDALYTTASWVRAKTLGDIEGELDAIIRLSGMPLSAVNSVLGLVTLSFQIGHLFHSFRPYFLPTFFTRETNIAGVFLCAIEACFEIRGVERQIHFLAKLHSVYLARIKKILSIKKPLVKGIYLIQLA